MIFLRSTFIFLIFTAALVSRVLAQLSPAAPFDVSSLPNQTTITLKPIIIDAPSVTFDEVDQTGREHRVITAADYCDFLNAEALTDEENLYDEKMGSDPEAACIIRSGSPENFSYEVIAGREDFSVTYLMPKSADCFLRWLESNPSSAEEGVEKASKDDGFFLGSNWLVYCISSPFIAPADALVETNSNGKSIFHYTPGATIGQRILEYFCGALGLGIGGRVSELVTPYLLPATECLPAAIATIIIVSVSVAIFFGCGYLGEKLGKWLGS